MSEIFSSTELLFDKSKEGYFFSEKYSGELSVEELLPILKIVLDSGAFRIDEIQGMFDTLTSLINSQSAAKINSLLREEMLNYQSPQHNKAILKIIWDLNESILRKTKIELHHHTSEGNESSIVISPLSVIFMEKNFYLAAFPEERTGEYPAFFEIDKIDSFNMMNQQVYIRSTQIVDIAEIKKQLRKEINDKRG